MRVFAGIDEAGYGPLLGPLVIGRSVLLVDDERAGSAEGPDRTGPPPGLAPGLLDFWEALDAGVCRDVARRKGRIPINDSKKLHTQTAGVTHLERGVLAFAGCLPAHASKQAPSPFPADVGALCDALHEQTHRRADLPAWYAPAEEHPWQPVPTACPVDEIRLAAGILRNCLQGARMAIGDMGAAVVFENRFNHMVRQTRSKASLSFTFVCGHLLSVWEAYGQHHPLVTVDRQSGRTHYREPLALAFPDALITVLDESPARSAYRLTSGQRAMTVSFEVDADARSLPVALASMTAKYLRELMMARFNRWFLARLPDLKPTAGYATDGKRFLKDVTPHLPRLGLRVDQLRRSS